MEHRTTTNIYALLLVISGVCTQSSDDVYFTDQRSRGVFRMSLAGGSRSPLLHEELRNPIAVAYDDTSDRLFVTERGDNNLHTQRFILSYAQTQRKISRHHLPRLSIPDGLAVDPISGLLYYTDHGHDIIGVLTTDLRYSTVIINEQLKQPRGITLDPLEGVVYWTDWGDGSQHIGRANMDGTNRRDIVTRGLRWPNGITIDTTGPVKYLFWCDAYNEVIKRSKTDGSEITTIFGTNANFFNLVVDETYIYYTAWNKGAIQKVAKNGTGGSMNVGMVQAYNTTKYFGIAINKASIRLSGSNACTTAQRGGCSHICLPAGLNTRVCRCNEGYTLMDDGKGCEKLIFRNALLVSDQEKRGLFALDLDKNAVLRLPIFDHQSPTDIAYDNAIKQFFWVDAGHKLVLTGCLHRNCLNEIHKRKEGAASLVGIALDKDKLQVYVVDKGLATIMRMSYFGHQEKVLINSSLDKPQSIALDTRNGFMYWTSWGKQPQIERARMADGSERDNFVTTGLMEPTGLVFSGGKLFWSDARFGRIETIALDGTGRQILYEQLGANFIGLTYGDCKLYFSLGNDQNTYSLDLVTKDRTFYGEKLFHKIGGLQYFSEAEDIPRTCNITASPIRPVDGNTTEDPRGINQTIILGISVSIGGIIAIALIILVGILCYKHMSSNTEDMWDDKCQSSIRRVQRISTGSLCNDVPLPGQDGPRESHLYTEILYSSPI